MSDFKINSFFPRVMYLKRSGPLRQVRRNADMGVQGEEEWDYDL